VVVKNGLGQSLERRPQNCEPARLSPRLMTSTPPKHCAQAGGRLLRGESETTAGQLRRGIRLRVRGTSRAVAAFGNHQLEIVEQLEAGPVRHVEIEENDVRLDLRV